MRAASAASTASLASSIQTRANKMIDDMKQKRLEAKETYLRFTKEIIQLEAEQVNETLMAEAADLDSLKENFVASFAKIEAEA